MGCFQPRSVHDGFVGDKAALKQVFSDSHSADCSRLVIYCPMLLQYIKSGCRMMRIHFHPNTRNFKKIEGVVNVEIIRLIYTYM
jgi:hypothetical protein